jgi:hypothetical protein
MGYKTTRIVNRGQAMILITGELTNLSNATLATILDLIADSKEAKSYISYFENFLVESGD